MRLGVLSQSRAWNANFGILYRPAEEIHELSATSVVIFGWMLPI